MDKINDENLVLNYLSGDQKSLEILIKRYLKPIYGFIFVLTKNSVEAEDLTQEVFVKMWKNINKYETNRKFKTWLFCIAKNTVIDFSRKKKTIPFSTFENEEADNLFLENIKDVSLLPDEVLERKEEAENLSSVIARLSIKTRKIFELRLNLGYSFNEIAIALGEPLNTVRSRYRRGVFRLRKLFNIG
ncbi:MAG: RNA polymerase sigma factor [Patescibacteria group bacterium]|nr:RNA polymerase sigma factor [Patescibacteria group bacterium]